MVYYRFTFILFIGLITTTTFTQLNWLFEPVIGYDKFFFDKDNPYGLVVIVDESGNNQLLNSKGVNILDGWKFAKIYLTKSNGIATCTTVDKKFLHFNSKGKLLSGPYDDVNGYHRTNILMIKKDNLYGLIDIDGNVIRAPQYKNLKRVKRGVHKGSFANGNEEMIYVEETDGMTPSGRDFVLKYNSSKIKDRIIIKAKSSKKGYYLYGFTNMAGDMILEPNRYFSLHMSFNAQIMIARDSQTGKVGVLDKDAEIVIPFEYEQIFPRVIDNSYVIANNGRNFSIINLDGTIRATMNVDKMYPMRQFPFVKASNGDAHFFLTCNLKSVVADTFKSIRDPFKNNWTILNKGGLRGFYSFKTGKYTKPIYTKVSVPVIHDVFGVKKDSYFALFDVHQGKLLTKPIYKQINKVGALYIGIKEKKDTVVEDTILVQKIVKSYEVLDHEGKLLYGPVDHRITHLYKNLYKEQMGTDSVVLHNFQNGKSRIFYNDKIRFHKNNVAMLSKDQYCFTDDLFNLENPKTFQYLSSKLQENVRIYKDNGKYGLLHGKTIIAQAEFDEIKEIKDGMIKAKKNGKWGVLENSFVGSD